MKTTIRRRPQHLLLFALQIRNLVFFWQGSPRPSASSAVKFLTAEDAEARRGLAVAKGGALFLSMILVLSACVQSTSIKDLRPTVILISLDGFRADYLEKYEPPNLRSLARDGVQARWMIPSFPSKTFPNHYTIATGLYPQNHGIVENNIFDKGFNATFTMSNRDEVQNGRWWLGEPIWGDRRKAGPESRAIFLSWERS